MLDQIEQVTGKWWGLSREETWCNNVRWRSGHRVVGRGPGGRKMKDVRQHDMSQKFVATNLNLSSRDDGLP